MFDLKDCFGLPKEEDVVNDNKVGIEKLYESLPTFSLFCTPGHKGVLGKNDVTEYDGGRLFPSNSVEIAQDETAEFYSVKRARFLVCGASMGIKASVLAVDGDVIAPSFTHKCFFEGMTLAKRKAKHTCWFLRLSTTPSFPLWNDFKKTAST